jgi:hypothetical protein
MRALLLCLALIGCSPSPAQPVKLLTSDVAQGVNGCCVPVVSGVLVPDAEAGTALRVDGEGHTVVGIRPDGGLTYGETQEYLRPVAIERILPLTWPAGYTARQVGSEIEVLDASGGVAATTGHRYICAQHVDGSWSACIAAELT